MTVEELRAEAAYDENAVWLRIFIRFEGEDTWHPHIAVPLAPDVARGLAEHLVRGADDHEALLKQIAEMKKIEEDTLRDD